MDTGHLSISPSSPPVVPNSGNAKYPRDYTPAIAAEGIVSYLRDEEGWPKDKLKELGRFIIEKSGGNAVGKRQPTSHGTREAVIKFFAERFKTDSGPTPLLTPDQIDQSLKGTLGHNSGIVDLSMELDKEQTLDISHAVLDKTVTSNLMSETIDRGLPVSEFSYAVIKKICQSKSQDFTIREFLDLLKHPDSPT